MRVRVDSAFVGSVLFSVALLWLLPFCWGLAVTGRSKSLLNEPDVWLREVRHLTGQLGVACLAVIFIGLIVTWGAYVKRSKWAWLMMLVLTWAWAFPIFVLPLTGHWVLSFREVLYDALYHSGPARVVVESFLTFSLMVLALLLPLPSFIRSGDRQPRWPPHRVISVSGFTLLFIVVGLFVWTHLAVYEIPPEQLRVQWPLPPPPAPSNIADKCR